MLSRKLRFESLERRTLLAGDVVEPLVAVDLQITDVEGDRLDLVHTGHTFYLEASVRDLRPNDPVDCGVFSAYFDVDFDNALAEAIGTPEFGDHFPDARHDSATPGLIDEVGAARFEEEAASDCSDRHLLFRVPMLAKEAGETVFSSNAAEDIVHEITVLALPEDLRFDRVDFGETRLHIFDPLMAVRLEAADLDGNPITEVELGESFRLNTWVQDVRPEQPTPRGVFSAYVDLEASYLRGNPPTFFVDMTGPIEHGERFTEARHGAPFSTISLVGLGGVASFTGPVVDDTGEHLLTSVVMTAVNEGEVDFHNVLSHATPVLETTLLGMDREVEGYEVIFKNTSLDIVDSLESIVGVRLETVDVMGQPLTEVEPGDEFFLQAWVQDSRPETTPDQGVFAAYLDMLFPEELVEVSGSIEYGTYFPNGHVGDVSTPGLLDEVGGFIHWQPNQLRDDHYEHLLARVPMTAKAGGEAVFRSDPANATEHRTLLLDDSAVQDGKIAYGSTTLQIREMPDLAMHLRTVDAEGRELESVEPGDEFFLQVWTQDVRSAEIPDQGVFTAYLDVLFPEELVEASGPIAYGRYFTNGRTGDVNRAGLINDAGGFIQSREGQLQDDPHEQLLISVPMTAKALGSATFVGERANETPLHESLFWSETESIPPSDVDFGQTTLEIVESAETLPPSETSDASLAVRLRTVDVNGKLIDRIAPHRPFYLEAWVEDVRPDAIPDQGVFAAYMDVTYTQGVVRTGDRSELEYSPYFPNGYRGDDLLAVDGLIDGAGAFTRSGSSSIRVDVQDDPYEHLLYRVLMYSGQQGEATFTSAPGDGVGEEMLFENNAEVVRPEDVEFGQTTLTVARDPAIHVRLETVDEHGSPIEEAQLGDSFFLQAWVRDARTEPYRARGDGLGILAPYIDVSFSEDLVDADGAMQFSGYFPNRRGEFASVEEGLIDELGAQAEGSGLDRIEVDPYEHLLVRIPMRAEAVGEAHFASADASNRPVLWDDPYFDDHPLHGETTLRIVDTSEPSLSIQLTTTDADGDPLDQARVGETFWLEAWAQDVRPVDAAQRGVFSAYVDVLFSEELIETAGEMEFGDRFPDARRGDLETPGLLNEAGAALLVSDINEARDFGEPHLLFRVPMKAKAEGTASLVGESADDVLSESLIISVIRPLEADEIDFGSATIAIGAPPQAEPDYFTIESRAGEVLMDVLANDDPGLTLLEAGPTDRGGNVRIDEDGQLWYEPASQFLGTETFTYKAELADGMWTEATVTVEVVSPWQNRGLPEDVTGEGNVTALDVLATIHEINVRDARNLFEDPGPDGGRWDVNGDGEISPLDALAVIRYVNELFTAIGASGEGEGEPEDDEREPQFFVQRPPEPSTREASTIEATPLPTIIADAFSDEAWEIDELEEAIEELTYS